MIERWMKARSAHLSATRFYEDPRPPDIDDIDWLIILGGPMSVNDESAYPWLGAEQRCIARAIAEGKVVLGVCLGAQLIAAAMGASVYPNEEREIGWLPVERMANAQQDGIAGIFPDRLEVFQWHGETFDLPAQALKIARSAACENQAFSIGERVLGLQFHLEATPATIEALIEHCRTEMTPGRFVQSAEEMLRDSDRFERAHTIMASVLDRLAALV
jgi:GMP synthase-like glutamine amidotransferase